MNIHYLQHVPFEDLGAIADWARQRGHTPTGSMLFEAFELPPVHDFDCLIVLGGPMNVYQDDQYPWLRAEKAIIAGAIAAGKAVLGICLGGQLIATVLGAKVSRNADREIGWFSLDLTPKALESPLADLPQNMKVLHWHGDTFGLPMGAVALASSEACALQAFTWGDRVLALQFHLETTPAAVARLVEHCSDELQEGLFVQTPAALLDPDVDYAELHRALFTMLDRWVQPVSAR